MINAELYTNEQLIEIRQKSIDNVKKHLPSKYWVDFANAMEAEHHLTFRER